MAVQLEQLGGPQGSLLATSSRPDLDQDILRVVRVLRDQQFLELGAELRDARLGADPLQLFKKLIFFLLKSFERFLKLFYFLLDSLCFYFFLLRLLIFPLSLFPASRGVLAPV